MIDSRADEVLLVGRRARVIDVSPPLDTRYPCAWPGHTPFETRIDIDFSATESFRTGSLSMDEHTGTHVDAPIHSIPPRSSGLPGADGSGDRTVAEIPLAELIGPAVVVDAPPSALEQADAGRSPMVTAEVLSRVEREHGTLRARDIVLLRTGWDARYQLFPEGRAYTAAPLAGESPGWPAPDPGFVELLRDRGVRCLGVDTPSIGALHDPGPAHVLALRNGIWPVESLANLGALPVRGATFVFLPIATAGSGGPGRAIALLPLDV